MYLSTFQTYLIQIENNGTSTNQHVWKYEECLVEHINVKNHYIIHHPEFIKNKYIKRHINDEEYFINKKNGEHSIKIKEMKHANQETEGLNIRLNSKNINYTIDCFIETTNHKTSRCLFKNCSEQKFQHKQFCIFHHQKTL